MNDVLALVSSLTPMQWIAVAVLGLVAFRNLDFLKGAGSAVLNVLPTASKEPGAGAAFAAVQTLIAHFEATGCKEGLAAARKTGKCLFDAPGEQA